MHTKLDSEFHKDTWHLTAHTCVVTGGTGFIGSHLVRGLIRRGWKVRVLARRATALDKLQGSSGRTPQLITGDFWDEALLANALDGVDTVFHFATTTKPASAPGISRFDVETNLLGTMRLLEVCAKVGVSRFIFASSGGTVYGVTSRHSAEETLACNPICSYGIVKFSIESYLRILARESGTQHTVLRYSNPYGPHQRPDGKQGIVAAFASKMLREEMLDIWGDGTTIRDYLFIDDLIDATIAAAESQAATNETINVGSGRGVSVNELIASLEHVLKRKAVVRYHPSRGFDVPINVLAIEKARALLDWHPLTSLPVGLKKTSQWLQEDLEGLQISSQLFASASA